MKRIVINEIIASNLEDTGSFYDAQDPLVVITIPPNNNITTSRLITLFPLIPLIIPCIPSLLTLVPLISLLIIYFILIRQEDSGTFAHWINEYTLNINDEDLNKEVNFHSSILLSFFLFF